MNCYNCITFINRFKLYLISLLGLSLLSVLNYFYFSQGMLYLYEKVSSEDSHFLLIWGYVLLGVIAFNIILFLCKNISGSLASEISLYHKQNFVSKLGLIPFQKIDKNRLNSILAKLFNADLMGEFENYQYNLIISCLRASILTVLLISISVYLPMFSLLCLLPSTVIFFLFSYLYENKKDFSVEYKNGLRVKRFVYDIGNLYPFYKFYSEKKSVFDELLKQSYEISLKVRKILNHKQMHCLLFCMFEFLVISAGLLQFFLINEKLIGSRLIDFLSIGILIVFFYYHIVKCVEFHLFQGWQKYPDFISFIKKNENMFIKEESSSSVKENSWLNRYSDKRDLALEIVNFKNESNNESALCLEIKIGEKILIVEENRNNSMCLIKYILGMIHNTSGYIYVLSKNIKFWGEKNLLNIFSVFYEDIIWVDFEDREINNNKFEECERIMKEIGIREIPDNNVDEEIFLNNDICQRYLLELVNLFSKNARIYLLDLDLRILDVFPKLRILFNKFLESLSPDKTVICFTSKLSNEEYFDKIYLLENGELKKKHNINQSSNFLEENTININENVIKRHRAVFV
ncbi:MAG: hypothetical protein ACD_79C01527G0013 [uncultured bacterium]|nr:MAG: hypothetical protein ACD_79C01527G0013 [uncultured bacterium]